MENTSGIYPSGQRVVILPEKIKKKGLIELPDTVIDTHMNAQTAGYLVAVGPDSWTDYSEPFAEVGERVMYAKYHGQAVLGKDGEVYRVINDEDITARLDPEVELTGIEAREPLARSA